jgi:NADH dehydrogenase FAD-containing subunit
MSRSEPSSKKHIIILGSGFAGVQVLKNVQKKFRHDRRVDITLISRDNFLSFINRFTK